ncbi:hypothetical protein [Carnimonas nigrificans]|uniref:hypothetical protein n=1 Tax=Carnimonas nigrificans TaxID=64323 RepID=UPI00047161E8|nr:hypothetical protein [Carnimonas nigrificans]
MSESASHNRSYRPSFSRRRHGWLLTGLLVTCLLPIAMSSALMQHRLELMTAELSRIAFQVPETIRAVSRRRSVRQGRRAHRVYLGQVILRCVALPQALFIAMTTGQRCFLRRGPPGVFRH